MSSLTKLGIEMPNNQELQNIPNNGGMRIVANLSTNTGRPEAWRTRRVSRKLLKTLRDHFST